MLTSILILDTLGWIGSYLPLAARASGSARTVTAQVCSAVCTPSFPPGTSLPPVVSLKLKIGGYLASGQWRKTLLQFELGVKGRHFVHLNGILLGCKYRRKTMFYRVGVQCPDIELLRKMKWPDVQCGKETGSWLPVLCDRLLLRYPLITSPPYRRDSPFLPPYHYPTAVNFSASPAAF